MSTRHPAGLEPRLLPALHLLLILALGGLALIAEGVTRFEFLVPTSAVIDALLFKQLLSLHDVVLRYFVLLPVIPLVFGLSMMPTLTGERTLAFPRLAVASLVLHGLAAILLIIAFLQGKIEPGWAYAVASPATVGRVSAVFLASLSVMFLSLQLTGLNLIVTIYKSRAEAMTPFVSSLYWTSWLMQIVLPVAQAALALALVESTLAMGIFDGLRGGSPTLLPWIFGLTATPMQVMMLLPVLGLVFHIVTPQDGSSPFEGRIHWYMAAFALLSVPALDPRAMPGDISWISVQLGAFFKVLMLVLLVPMVLNLVRVRFTTWTVARMYGLAALAMIVVFAPLDLFLTLGGATEVFRGGYLVDGHFRLMIAGSCLLVLLGAAHHLRGDREPVGGNVATFLGIVIVFGLLATHMPMLIIGQHALPTGFAVYPEEFLPLQVMITLGGTLFVTGFAGGLLQLAGRRT